MSTRAAAVHRRNPPLAPVLVIGLSVFLSCAQIACHDDRRELFYPSLADAEKDGAMDRGWLPDFLPESSRAIHELGDMSPATTWCAFEFLPSDSKGFRKNLKSADVLAPSVRRVPNAGKPWWPAVLEGDLDVRKIQGAGLEVYIIETPETPSSTAVWLFAIDWAKGHGFIFRTRRTG